MGSPPWSEAQLASHPKVFPEGQLVAEQPGGEIIGYAASLIVNWDDYDFQDSWRDMTDSGMFTNHDPGNGRTLYGAEIMVDPASQGKNVGKRMYRAREELVIRLNLLRVRAGARLRGYGAVADRMSAREYVLRVVRGELVDPTLTFQLNRGFQVLSVTSGYLRFDAESAGYAAVIEWLNPALTRPEDIQRQKASPFYRPSGT